VWTSQSGKRARRRSWRLLGCARAVVVVSAGGSRSERWGLADPGPDPVAVVFCARAHTGEK